MICEFCGIDERDGHRCAVKARLARSIDRRRWPLVLASVWLGAVAGTLAGWMGVL